MNICMIATQVYPSATGSIIGGVAVSVFTIANELNRRGFKVTLITSRPQISSANKFSCNEFKIHLLDVKGEYLSTRYAIEFINKSIKKALSLYKDGNIEIVHTHSGYPQLGVIGYFLSKFYKIPTVHSQYCPVRAETDKLLIRLLTGNFLTRNFYLNVNKIIAISQNVRKSMESIRIAPQKIVVIPPPISENFFNHEIKNGEIGHKESVTLLFVGNTSKEKGLMILLKAMKLLIKKENMKINLVVVLHEHQNKIAKVSDLIKELGISENVKILGVVKDMPKLMSMCYAVVVPFTSTFGPSDYPLIIIEAAALRKPIIASNIGGIKELIHHRVNGLLTKPSDYHSLAQTIKYLIENNELAVKLGENAAKNIENFHVKKVVDQLEKVYYSIA